MNNKVLYSLPLLSKSLLGGLCCSWSGPFTQICSALSLLFGFAHDSRKYFCALKLCMSLSIRCYYTVAAVSLSVGRHAVHMMEYNKQIDSHKVRVANERGAITPLPLDKYNKRNIQESAAAGST